MVYNNVVQPQKPKAANEAKQEMCAKLDVQVLKNGYEKTCEKTPEVNHYESLRFDTHYDQLQFNRSNAEYPDYRQMYNRGLKQGPEKVMNYCNIESGYQNQGTNNHSTLNKGKAPNGPNNSDYYNKGIETQNKNQEYYNINIENQPERFDRIEGYSNISEYLTLEQGEDSYEMPFN